MSFLSQPLQFISISPVRSFAGISGYFTYQENTTDTLTITKQPIQNGANIADHAYKEPISLSVQIGFSAGLSQSLSDIYQSLLALQQPTPPPVVTLTPFVITTPKRTYHNMLLANLGVTTDKKTENILSVNATFQETIIVPVTTTSVPASQLRTPSLNQATQAVGNKSGLFSLATGLGLRPP